MWKRADRQLVNDQRALADQIGLLIMRSANGRNEAGDVAIAPLRREVEALSDRIWQLILKPYFIGPTDEPLTGIQPNSPYTDVLVDGIRDATLLEARQHVAETRRLLSRRAPDVLAYLVDGEDLPQGPLTEQFVAPGFDTSDFRDASGRIDPEAARAAFVRPRGTYDSFHRFVDPNGYRLSDRVWQSGFSERQAIDRYVQYHVSQGTSAVDTAKGLEGFLTGSAATQRTPKPYGTNGSYAARRLARTEITAAAGRSTIAMSAANPYVGGVKWNLSPSHRDVDPCDENSRGGPNGDGVYPPADVPRYPNHPNCLCTLSPQGVSNVDEVVADLRKKVRRARDAVVGGAAQGDPDIALRMRGLLNPQRLTDAAMNGELQALIRPISQGFVRSGLPARGAGVGREPTLRVQPLRERRAAIYAEDSELLRLERQARTLQGRIKRATDRLNVEALRRELRSLMQFITERKSILNQLA